MKSTTPEALQLCHLYEVALQEQIIKQQSGGGAVTTEKTVEIQRQ